MNIPEGYIKVGNKVRKMRKNEIETIDKFNERVIYYNNNNCEVLTKKYPGKLQEYVQYICQCGKVDEVTVKVFLRNCGCPDCDKKRIVPWTNEKFDKIINLKGIIRLGEVINDGTPVLVKCLKDGYEWGLVPNYTKREIKCPQCEDCIPWSNERIDEVLLDRNIKRNSDFTLCHHMMKFECLVEGCGHKWETTVTSVCNSGTGCEKCNNSLKQDNCTIDKRVKDNNLPIIRIGEYVNCSTPLLWRCLACNKEWNATSDDVLNQGTGCPGCAKGKSERKLGELIKKHVKYTEWHKPQRMYITEDKWIVPDFYLEVNSKKVVIERNGEQHYKPVRFGGISIERAQKNFEKQKIRDKMKIEYYKELNIHLLEVHYKWDKEKIIEELKKLNEL